ncbi:hypothetical protein COP2_010882 [Malus domestica]
MNTVTNPTARTVRRSSFATLWRVAETSQTQGQIFDQDLGITPLSGARRSTTLKIGERFASSAEVLRRWKFFILPIAKKVKNEGEK